MGTADPDFPDPAAEADWIVAHLAHAERLLVDGAGHYPQAEEPETVNPAADRVRTTRCCPPPDAVRPMLPLRPAPIAPTSPRTICNTLSDPQPWSTIMATVTTESPSLEPLRPTLVAHAA